VSHQIPFTEWPSETSRSTARPARLRGDDGVALVEFALVFPLLMVLLFGIISAGLLWNQELSLTHAAREGARYGATVPRDQAFTSGTWAANVRTLVVDRSGGELDSVDVCISLVEGTGAATAVVSGGGLPATNWTTQSAGTPCLPNQVYPLVSAADAGRRVQVVVTRPSSMDLVFYRLDLTLRSDATARAESTT
jgi:Flp pilus assembly protein TadG